VAGPFPVNSGDRYVRRFTLLVRFDQPLLWRSTMDILVIGGTRFVGRHLVEAALARGHGVTLFNRGSQADLFPQLELIRGDRDHDIERLAGRRWDAVIDTCGYVPRQLEASAGLLADTVGHYTFISSISVYADQEVADQDEDAPLGELAEATEEVTAASYGPLKVLCERAAEAAMPGRVLIPRPGLIVGPHDPTDRFTYWPARLDRGGEVLAPGDPDNPVQWIDGRDLATWTVTAIERGLTGPFNMVAPARRDSLADLVEACRAAVDNGARLTWVDGAFLLEREIQPFVDLPFWLPGDAVNFLTVDSGRAHAEGLLARSTADTVVDTLAWHRTRSAPADLPGRLSAEREAEVLAAWHTRG
jgi:2'-hydroxyisoflavone reductase